MTVGDNLIKLDDVCDLFGLAKPVARRRAAQGRLPLAVFRLGGAKSHWLINREDLEAFIASRRAEAEKARTGALRSADALAL